MKVRLPVLLFLIASGFAFTTHAQQSDITTLIFVRHAEKANDGGSDPELSAEGMKRASRLSEVLAKQGIDAIYSTDFKRTKNTVSPLAARLKLTVVIYTSATAEYLRDIVQKYKGGTVVICGHSNTTPAMVNLLTRSETMKQFDDDDYNNLIIVSVTVDGGAKVTRLTY